MSQQYGPGPNAYNYGERAPRSGALGPVMPPARAVATQPPPTMILPSQGRRAPLWLRLTSWHAGQALVDVRAQERQRRSVQLAWVLLAMLICDIAVLLSQLQDVPTALACVSVVLACIVALLCNRWGAVFVGGWLAVLVLDAAIYSTLLIGWHGVLVALYLPAFDLFVVAQIVAATVLPRIWTWPVLALNIALVVSGYLALPRAGELLTDEVSYGIPGEISRPIAMLGVVAVVSFLWVSASERAIERATQADQQSAYLRRAFEQDRARTFQVLHERFAQLEELLDIRNASARRPWGRWLRAVDRAQGDLRALEARLSVMITKASLRGPGNQGLQNSLEQLRYALQEYLAGRAAFDVMVLHSGNALVDDLAGSIGAALTGAAMGNLGAPPQGSQRSQHSTPFSPPYTSYPNTNPTYPGGPQ